MTPFYMEHGHSLLKPWVIEYNKEHDIIIPAAGILDRKIAEETVFTLMTG